MRTRKHTGRDWDSPSVGRQYAELWRGVFNGPRFQLREPGKTKAGHGGLLAHLPATVELAVSGMFVAFLIAFPLGIAAALVRYVD